MLNIEELRQIFIDNKDKRICVLGTTCTGKTTLINESNMGVDMDEEIFPLLTEEETEYVCQTPWTEEIGNKMDELVIEQLEKLDDTLAVRDINIHNLLKVQPVMFIGGGAELFKEHINKFYKSDVIDNLVVVDALKANVRGFYEYGVAKFA